MTPCADKDAMLQALLDGELDAANTLAIEAHLATCAACAWPRPPSAAFVLAARKGSKKKMRADTAGFTSRSKAP